MRVTEEEYRRAYLILQESGLKRIDRSQIVVVNGKMVPIGIRLYTMTKIYQAMQKGKHYGNYKDLTEEQISWWKEHELDLSKQRGTKKDLDAKYREAWLIWKKEHSEETCVPYCEVVTLKDGKKVPLGRKIHLMMYIYQAMQEGKHYGKSKDLTEEQITWWTSHGLNFPEIQSITESDYQEAWLLWKEQNKENKRVPIDAVITLENGKVVDIGKKIHSLKKIIKTYYQVKQKGSRFRNIKGLTEEQIAWWNNQEIDWNQQKELRESKNKKLIVKDILDGFNISLEEFETILAKIKTKSKEEKVTVGDENMTLGNFCIKGGYSKKIVFSAIRLHKFFMMDTLEQLVDRILSEKENEPSPWVYEVYGTSISSILTELGFNANSVLLDVSKRMISLEEAICFHTFKDTCRKESFNYLDECYQQLIGRLDFHKSEQQVANKIASSFVSISKRHNLIEEEKKVLKQSINNYFEKIKEYHIIDVGLEMDPNKKIEKIRRYNLPEEDIEESYFVPFRFESGKLLGRKSVLYQRRNLLRQYIIDWDYYTEEEKEQIRMDHSFTIEELGTIQNTRMEINHTLEKVKRND